MSPEPPGAPSESAHDAARGLRRLITRCGADLAQEHSSWLLGLLRDGDNADVAFELLLAAVDGGTSLDSNALHVIEPLVQNAEVPRILLSDFVPVERHIPRARIDPASCYTACPDDRLLDTTAVTFIARCPAAQSLRVGRRVNNLTGLPIGRTYVADFAAGTSEAQLLDTIVSLREQLEALSEQGLSVDGRIEHEPPMDFHLGLASQDTLLWRRC